jgi:glycosyltransferase involved in cell wall biosynthesis
MVKDMPIYRYGASFNKFFDYLVMARPTVIAASIPRNPFLESNSGICVAPGDSSALAAACITLAQMSQSQRQSMGTAGRKYVEDHHSMGILATRLENVLQDAIKQYSQEQFLVH